MPPNKISQFERQNPDIAVHVLAYDESTKSFIVLYLRTKRIVDTSCHYSCWTATTVKNDAITSG